MIRINKGFIICTALAFVFAFLFGGNLPYTIFYVLIVSLMIQCIYIQKISKDIYLGIDRLNERYSVGDKCTLNILVKNYSLPYVYVENTVLKKFSNNYNGHCLFLDSSGSELIKIDVEFKNRGIYDLGKFHLCIYDIFNFFYMKKDKHVEDAFIKIYPKIHTINKKILLGGGSLKAISINKNCKDNYSCIKDVRKYVTGDSLKKIHWKLSAKHRELYVKNYEDEYGERCCVFLDVNKKNLQDKDYDLIEETCVEVLVSLVNFIIGNGVKLNIFVNNKDYEQMEVYNKSSFEEFMEVLIREKVNGYVGVDKLLSTQLKKIGKGEIIYLIISGITKEIYETAYELYKKNYKLIIIYNFYDNNTKKYGNKLNEIGVKCAFGKDFIKDN
ncbi:DUF58 domain-containing protein [Haloimpatiens sp. FM7315]|uniref:DUF58 domain-containing protein n=1 Tax=Haloimpatiens sp. FM7315 TaxID=3298609 RepID=UPI00370A6418